MCLITEQKTAITIKEDMIVYKVLENGRSPYYDFIWTKGKMESIRKMRVIKEVSIGGDDDTYYADDISHYTYEDKLEKCIAVQDGFHSCIDKERAHRLSSCGGETIHEFLIPSGAKIFKDDTGFIVSDKIMFIN